MENLIKKITDDARRRGFEVRIRDVAYALLKVKFQDDTIAFTVVFGTPESDHAVADYDSMESIKYLVRWFEKDLAPKEIEKERPEDVIKALKKKSSESDDGAMSFEDNRAGIETQIEEILGLKKELIGEDGKCTDVKTMATLQKTEADLRAKLNDKFGASEKSSEQYIIVQKKFDFVCPYTRHECYQMNKEDAKKKWNLIEKE